MKAAVIARLRYRLMDNDDWLWDKMSVALGVDRSDKVWERYENWVLSPLERHVFPRLCRHEAEQDHCGMPHHDLCKGCGKRMPNQAPRLGSCVNCAATKAHCRVIARRTDGELCCPTCKHRWEVPQ